eukprot:29971-Pelagococcus_subviridis.AAC.4
MFRDPLNQPVRLERVRREPVEVEVLDAHLSPAFLQTVPTLLRGERLLPSPLPLQPRAIRLVPLRVFLVVRLQEERHAKHAEPQRIVSVHRRPRHLAHRVLQVTLADEPVGSHRVAYELHGDELVLLGRRRRRRRRRRHGREGDARREGRERAGAEGRERRRRDAPRRRHPIFFYPIDPATYDRSIPPLARRRRRRRALTSSRRAGPRSRACDREGARIRPRPR